MKNIEELNATIEELEKRIKAISSAGATLAQIIAVRDSLEQVKVCLNNLTTAIKDEEDDASVAQLTALEQRVATAETDITTLQTDLTSTQDDLETVWNNLASTNSVVGEHTTTLTNLQTAQTNLQTTQTNQASTITTNTTDISNLKTRMTTAENNISALTGGVDVSAIDNKISNLDNFKKPVFNNGYIHRFDEYNLTSSDTTFFSKPFAYTCTDENRIRIVVKIKVTLDENCSNNMTLSLISSNSEQAYLTKNISSSIDEYIIEKEFTPGYRYDIIAVYFNNCQNLTIKSIDFEIYGGELKEIELYKDLYCVCFNNNRYITYKKNNIYYYGKYSLSDTIDLDNMPNSHNFTETSQILYNFMFTPVFKYEYGINDHTQNADGRLLLASNIHNLNAFEPPADDVNKFLCSCSKFMYGIPTFGYSRPFTATIHNSIPAGCNINVKNAYTKFENYKSKQNGSWLLGFDIINNYLMPTSTYKTSPAYRALMLNENGYIYFFHKTYLNYILKIGIGSNAIAFEQQNNDINVYITNKKNVDLYKLVFSENDNKYSCQFSKTYTDCDYIIEILNNQILKHTKDGWNIISIT